MSSSSVRWLLLNGLCRERRHREVFDQILSRRLPDARCFCLDNPGCGDEAHRASPWSIAGIVDDIRERWLKLREEHPGEWHVSGISLGGMITMDWASRYPEDFRSAVVIVSSAGNVSPPHHRMRPNVYFTVFGSALVGDQTQRERRVLGKISNRPELRDEMAPRYAAISVERPLRRGTGIRQITAGTTFRAPHSIPIPTLILGSHGDRFVHPRCSEQLARRLQAPLRMHESGGHELTLDAADWCAEQMAAWLDGPELHAARLSDAEKLAPLVS